MGTGQAHPVAAASLTAAFVSSRVLDVEGPVFAETINKVSSLLSQHVIRQLNAAVDIYHQDPALVAKEFLIANGLMPVTSP